MSTTTPSSSTPSTSSSSSSSLPKTGEEREREEQARQKASDEAAEAAEPKQLDALHTEHGDTSIADQVVEKIAGIATREVQGVYAMGSAAGRAIGSITSRLSGNSNAPVSSGVTIQKGERQAAVDVSVVVEYGVSIVGVADDIRQSVIDAVEHATGLEVVEVNVNVTDVHLPDDDSGSDQQAPAKSTDRLA